MDSFTEVGLFFTAISHARPKMNAINQRKEGSRVSSNIGFQSHAEQRRNYDDERTVS